LGASGRTHYEVEEFKEKDPTTREASARGLDEIGQPETKAAGGRVSKGDESREEIGCSRYCGQVFNWRDETEQRQETEEKTESLARTSRATFGRDESQVGCQTRSPGKREIRRGGSRFCAATTAAAAGKQT